jgi:hypothetical protein
LDTKEYSNWMMNTSFASYAWNGSPIDGTDIIRSFAAKARTFHFPLDVKEQLPRIIGNPGERALQHVESGDDVPVVVPTEGIVADPGTGATIEAYGMG